MKTLLTLLLAAACTTAGAQVTKKPNIIYIMADDMGYGDVGFNGQKKIKTPNIDQLAAEGIIFTAHYAGTSVCAPSRAALMTGVNTAHGHIRELSAWTASGNAIDLLDEEITVAEELKRAGYSTAVIGKWGMDESNTTGKANKQGFDYFYGYKTHTEAHHYYPEYIWENDTKLVLAGNVTAEKKGEYSNDAFTRKALDFIRNHKSSPFFLYLPYTVPHNEITAPADSKAPYENLDWPKRPMQAGHYYHDAEGNTAYAGMVSRLDRYVGEIMAELKKQGLDENTFVIFTSDNGPAFDNGFFDSNGPYRGRKLTLYEAGVREPFAARWPGKIKPGQVTAQPAAFWDFLPTACEMAGIKPSKKIDGISYLPTLLGKTQPQHDFFYWEINETQGPVQAIRMGKWKGINAYQKPFELYDLEADPAETTNLAEKNPGIVAKIRKTMFETRTENPEFPLTKRTAHYGNDGSGVNEKNE
ncbi:arylsulfatase [Hufsiella ginkgonis]|uniref:Sulfatase-like hydrolase/transferase n=1 Tax=Hufsiella ginkgonis TaxID=2695274 RepID=A0A7K1XSC8_9SPHI|nr:arylsulfatase [Hufsiella ginkgonis]MXV13767.1 sulfatase-like hydrolase/transferase [Hufsiella ginkgonis]